MGLQRDPGAKRLRGGTGWKALWAAGLLALGARAAASAQPPTAAALHLNGPWNNPKLSPDVRAQSALAVMTIEEKLVLLRTPMPTMLASSKRPQGLPLGAGFISGVPRLGIGPVAETDASLGVSNLAGMRRGDVATALPASLALGSSWDPEIAYRSGAMIGSEARAKGFGVMLAGGANLVRDPRAGRNFEYISEDPLLTGVLAGRSIAGVQSARIVSTMKHFAINDQETGRNVYSVEMTEGAMRQSDLLAFEIAHEIGQPGSVMCAYNKVGGVSACENPFLLNQVLRRDWGFKGFVMSDWGAVHSVGALQAGLDQQSGYQLDPKPFFGGELEKALAAKQIPQSAVDTAAYRILRTLFAHDLVDNPPVAGEPIDYDAHGKVAQAQAEAGIVLLRNEGRVLPLTASAKRIAVIGGHADIGVLSGGGSSQVIPAGGLTLERKQKGEGLTSFIKRSYGGTAPLAALKAAFPQAQVSFADGSDVTAAAALAAQSDVAVVFAEKWFYESVDSPDMALGEDQDQLIAAVAKANPKVVVVLETGNPVAMPWRDNVPAILAAWYPGQRGGEAIARVLSGAVNPSGHLPVTWPKSLDQLPQPRLPGWDAPRPTEKTANYGIANDRAPFHYTYREGEDAGYRWFDKTKAEPLYAFGHGLSYTTFRYDGLSVAGGKTPTVRFTVTNTGDRPGADVPQVYVVQPGQAKRLVGWARPELGPGQSKQVSVTVDPRLLGRFDATTHAWIVPAGAYRIEIARSATDPVLTGEAKAIASRLPPRVPTVAPRRSLVRARAAPLPPVAAKR